jgi:ribosomal protein L44E
MTAFEYLVLAVEKAGDECMLWPYRRNAHGYGELQMPLRMTGKPTKTLAHRVAFMVKHGHLPQPFGCHRCDNPRCFNPNHIFEGTPLDNQRDCIAKGRKALGVEQGRAKLTEEMVRAARVEYAEGNIGFAELASKYGVSKPSMLAAVTGKTWTHVDGAIASIERGRIARASCGRGHPFTPGSFYTQKSGIRSCKKCKRIHEANRLARLKEMRRLRKLEAP